MEDMVTKIMRKSIILKNNTLKDYAGGNRALSIDIGKFGAIPTTSHKIKHTSAKHKTCLN